MELEAWLGLAGVVLLFALGVVAYNIRTRRTGSPRDLHAPEGRPVRRRGGQKFKKSGPFDNGPQVPQDPSSIPTFFHHGPGV
ncbi:hypothetical protein [Tessaracoccus antarcticus]|uniref:Uncharacterized protein n=1 Tax=Tessaracoccus antarcticus TaxID=2479848 RepID=A0A3M0G8H6_9ACTN|nr:hypothetical protein [Tessaracoccus antarcticus]RMB58722.1 hypothetical protein EAX62_11330 [Tessaracoccus antarcticus]